MLTGRRLCPARLSLSGIPIVAGFILPGTACFVPILVEIVLFHT